MPSLVTKARRWPPPKPPDGGLTPLSFQLSPLQYLLATLNDETADARRREKAAIAAAPFVHSKPAPTGKKAEAAKAAQKAGRGTEWATDLDYSDGRRKQ